MRKNTFMLVLICLITITMTVSAEETITIWHPWGAHADAPRAVAMLAQEFEDLHGNVRIEMESKGPNDTLVATAAGAGPDIFIVGHGGAAQIIDAGIAVPWDRLDPDIDALRNDIYPGIVAELSRKGQLYGIALVINTLALFANMDAIAEAGLEERLPETWRDLEEMALRLVKTSTGTDTPDRWGFVAYTSPVEMWEAMFYQHGGEWILPDGRPGIDQAPAVEAASFFEDAVNRYRYSPFPTWRGQGQSMFPTGETAMMIAPSGTGSFTGAARATFAWDVDAIPMGEQSGNVITGARVLVLEGPKPQLAYEFVQYLTSTDNLVRYSANVNGLLIARRSSTMTPEWQSLASEFRWLEAHRLPNQLMYANHTPPVVLQNPEINQSIRTALESNISGEMAIGPGLQEAARLMQTFLDEHR